MTSPGAQVGGLKTAKQQEPYRWIRQFTGEVAAKKMLGSLPRGGMEMRICLSALVVLGGCSAATPKVVTQTPASVSYEDVGMQRSYTVEKLARMPGKHRWLLPHPATYGRRLVASS